MFALPGLLALILVDYLRPQEYFPQLTGLPLLHLATAFSALGLAVDLRLGVSRLRAAPHLVLTLLFFAWCLVTVLVRAPSQLAQRAPALIIPLAVYLLVAHAVQSFRMLQVLCGALLAICLALAAFGVHQAMAPFSCHREVIVQSNPVLVNDGRPCEHYFQCEDENAEPGAHYRCERAGLLGTSSVNGRVRYRGTLEDPNELSLALSVALPFAFAFLDRRRSLLRTLLVGAAVVLVGICAYYTKSRGGQLVFLSVLAVYFVRRVGLVRGGVTGLLLALPLLAFGGRSGAEDSTMERLVCWWTGLHMLVASPGFGVGSGQFTEHHYLTAHNSYILAAAELGVVGMLLWSAVLYVAVKICLEAMRGDRPRVLQAWALAIFASMAGHLVGIMFLSYNYKNAFWIYVGLTGVLYHAIRRHDPSFEARFGLRDLGVVAAADFSLLFLLIGYTGLKLGW